MNDSELNLREFVYRLSSSSPTPGGGGAAALVGAIGTALSCMVGSLTVGKKKYRDVEEHMKGLCTRCEELQEELLSGIKADADGFMPLAEAYSVPRDDPDREKIIQKASELACEAPLRAMELCCEAIGISAEMADKGSALALSDAGCSAAILCSALKSSALNVYINTKGMTDREIAGRLNAKCDSMLERYVPMAQCVYEKVMTALQN